MQHASIRKSEISISVSVHSKKILDMSTLVQTFTTLRIRLVIGGQLSKALHIEGGGGLHIRGAQGAMGA